MKPAGREFQPAEQRTGRQLSPAGPPPHVVDDLIAGIVGNPVAVQSSPLAFFARTFSSISSAMTSFLLASLASSRSIRRFLA